MKTRQRRAGPERVFSHIPQMLFMLAGQLAIRLFALFPLWLPRVFPALRGIPPFSSFLFSCLIILLLYLLLVYPMRFSAALTLVRLVRGDSGRKLRLSPYFQLAAAGCLRAGLGVIWGIPFLLLARRFYQYIFVFDGTRFSRDFTSWGALLLPGADNAAKLYAGSLLFFGALLLAAALFLYGWHRGVPLDFQMVGSATALQALRRCRRIRRHCRRSLAKNALIHMLLCLAAIAAPVLIIYFKIRMMLTGDIMQDANLLYAFLSAGMISSGTLAMAAGAFVLLYLPLLPWRKARNADVVVNEYVRKR